MEMFTYTKAAGVPQAIEGGTQAQAKFIAGGTTLLDLMKLNVERPSRLIDINRLPLDLVETRIFGSRVTYERYRHARPKS